MSDLSWQKKKKTASLVDLKRLNNMLRGQNNGFSDFDGMVCCNVYMKHSKSPLHSDLLFKS